MKYGNKTEINFNSIVHSLYNLPATQNSVLFQITLKCGCLKIA